MTCVSLLGGFIHNIPKTYHIFFNGNLRMWKKRRKMGLLICECHASLFHFLFICVIPIYLFTYIWAYLRTYFCIHLLIYVYISFPFYACAPVWTKPTCAELNASPVMHMTQSAQAPHSNRNTPPLPPPCPCVASCLPASSSQTRSSHQQYSASHPAT